MPIAVLSEYTEKEYEPFDPYSRFYPAMPISVCFSDTALCTLGKGCVRVFGKSTARGYNAPCFVGMVHFLRLSINTRGTMGTERTKESIYAGVA